MEKKPTTSNKVKFTLMITLIGAIIIGLFLIPSSNYKNTMETETISSDTGQDTIKQISTDDYDAEIKIVEDDDSGDIDVFITYTDIKNKDKNPKDIIAEILETLPDMYDGSSNKINIRIPQSSEE